MTPPLLAPGSMLGARWIMGGLLGQSDGAEVYDAEEAHQRRFAAIKFFDPAFAVEPAWSEHATLTRTLSALPGDCIARSYDVGFEPAFRRPYVASERVTFPTLSRYVTERGPLSLRNVAQLLETLANGLDAAHGAGIVHGGLKPQNVFVSFENAHWARITDFCVARLRAATGNGSAKMLGWTAPEAAAGFFSAASDRYALGLLCFFAATGVPWYSALRARDEQPSSRNARLASERARSQGGTLEPLLDGWFETALAADPSARFATATEMARAFLAAFGNGPTAGLPVHESVHPFAATQRRPKSTPPPASEAPETPLAATVSVSVSASPARPIPFASPPSSIPPATPLSRAPSASRRLLLDAARAPWLWLWLTATGALLLAALVAWWLRTR